MASGISHQKLLSDIKIPTIFIHAKAMYSEDGILMAASSDEQAREAADLIWNFEFFEISGNHDIHRFQSEVFIVFINEFDDNYKFF